MKVRTYHLDFRRGLQTTHSEDGLDVNDHVVFQNARVRTKSAKRRKGWVHLDALTGAANTGLDFNGTDQYIHVWAAPAHNELGRYWTLHLVAEPDSVTGTRPLLAFNHATNSPLEVYLDAGVLTVEVQDNASTTVTLTSATTYTADTALAIYLERNGTALSLYVNGVLEDSDTMADLPLITASEVMMFARDQAANYFDGTFEYASLMSIARGNAGAESWKRFLDPRAEFVLFDYHMNRDAADRVIDRSRYENHGAVNGATAPGLIDSQLMVPFIPVQGMYPYRNRSNEKRIAIIAGALVYDVGID